jgi:hypothetical protein
LVEVVLEGLVLDEVEELRTCDIFVGLPPHLPRDVSHVNILEDVGCLLDRLVRLQQQPLPQLEQVRPHLLGEQEQRGAVAGQETVEGVDLDQVCVWVGVQRAAGGVFAERVGAAGAGGRETQVLDWLMVVCAGRQIHQIVLQLLAQVHSLELLAVVSEQDGGDSGLEATGLGIIGMISEGGLVQFVYLRPKHLKMIVLIIIHHTVS